MNFVKTIPVAVIAVVLTLQPTSGPAAAENTDGQRVDDVVELRSGGGLEVRLIDQTQTDNREFVVFETESGSIVKLDQKYISSVLPADADQKRYARLRDKLPDTVEANWEIIDWCKSQSRGRAKFKDQIQYHLENIIALEPNDRKARQLLGYEDFNGQWSLKELRYRKFGYVRHKSNWIPKLAQQIEKNVAQKDAKVGSWKEQFAKWTREIRRPRRTAAELERMLFDIVTPESANFVFEEGAKNKDQPLVLRKMYVEAFGRTPSLASAGALVYFGVQDVDSEVRERAVTLLLQPEFNQEFAMQRALSLLSSKNFTYSQRAALVIRYLSQVPGTDARGVLMPLIESLVSQRTVPRPGATEPGRLNTSFSNNGGLSFTAGGGPQTITKEVSNEFSLTALKRITGKDFGYNETLWSNFFVDNYTLSGEVRVDP
jgi:hypothetical protein